MRTFSAQEAQVTDFSVVEDVAVRKSRIMRALSAWGILCGHALAMSVKVVPESFNLNNLSRCRFGRLFRENESLFWASRDRRTPIGASEA